MRNLVLIFSLLFAGNAFADYFLLSEKADLQNVTADWQAVVKNSKTSTMTPQAGKCEGTLITGTLTERSVFLNSSQDKQEISSFWFVGTAPAIKDSVYDFSALTDAGSTTCSDDATGELKVYYKYRAKEVSSLTGPSAVDACLDDGACSDSRGRGLSNVVGFKTGNANNSGVAIYQAAACSGNSCMNGKKKGIYNVFINGAQNGLGNATRDAAIFVNHCSASVADETSPGIGDPCSTSTYSGSDTFHVYNLCTAYKAADTGDALTCYNFGLALCGAVSCGE